MSFVCKILMNSLYGRFGINPKTNMSELCFQKRYEYMNTQKGFLNGYALGDKGDYLIQYLTEDNRWKGRLVIRQAKD